MQILTTLSELSWLQQQSSQCLWGFLRAESSSLGTHCCYASAWPKQHSPQGERSRISWSTAEDSGADICCPGSALAPVSLHLRSHVHNYMRCIQMPSYEQGKAYTTKMAAKACKIFGPGCIPDGKRGSQGCSLEETEKKSCCLVDIVDNIGIPCIPCRRLEVCGCRISCRAGRQCRGLRTWDKRIAYTYAPSCEAAVVTTGAALLSLCSSRLCKLVAVKTAAELVGTAGFRM